MPEWLLIALGVITGLLVIGGAVWFSFRSAERQDRRKPQRAERSGREDTTPVQHPTDLLGE